MIQSYSPKRPPYESKGRMSFLYLDLVHSYKTFCKHPIQSSLGNILCRRPVKLLNKILLGVSWLIQCVAIWLGLVKKKVEGREPEKKVKQCRRSKPEIFNWGLSGRWKEERSGTLLVTSINNHPIS